MCVCVCMYIYKYITYSPEAIWSLQIGSWRSIFARCKSPGGFQLLTIVSKLRRHKMVKSPWGLKVNPYPHFVIEPLILMGTWCQISQAWLVQVEASGVARGIEASLLHLGGRFRSLFICTRARLYSTALAQSLRSSWTSAYSESCDSIKDHWEQPKWTTYPPAIKHANGKSRKITRLVSLVR